MPGNLKRLVVSSDVPAPVDVDVEVSDLCGPYPHKSIFRGMFCKDSTRPIEFCVPEGYYGVFLDAHSDPEAEEQLLPSVSDEGELKEVEVQNNSGYSKVGSRSLCVSFV